MTYILPNDWYFCWGSSMVLLNGGIQTVKIFFFFVHFIKTKRKHSKIRGVEPYYTEKSKEIFTKCVRNNFLCLCCAKIYSKVPPKDGRFGPKFSNPRAHPMRGDSIPHRGALRDPDPTLTPILGEGTLL